MLKFLNLQPEIFGADINDSSLRIVKIRKSRSGFLKLVLFNEFPIDPGIVSEGVIQDEDALVKIIKSACNNTKGKKLNTKYLIASLPEEKSFSQVIQMPKMNEEELKLSVPFEAENYIPLSIDKVYLDFKVISDHKDGLDHLDLLISVMPKSIIDSYVSCFKKAGLIPYILEVESQSITRALIKNGVQYPPLLLIDFGVSNTSFVIFSNNSVRFTASIPTSSKDITKVISEKLGIDFNKAEELKIRHGLLKDRNKKNEISEIIMPILTDLALQIKKYISFYSSHSAHEYLSSFQSRADKKIEKIILCGGGANLKGLLSFLASELKIPVELGNPLVNIANNYKKDGKNMPEEKILSFTTALGLAIRGAKESL